MRIAIISDTHFGDDHSQMVSKAVLNKKYYEAFRQAVRDRFEKCDYLVLAGDILDFSIASYDEAYKCADVFFKQIRKDNLTDKVIYIAGNHDADIWHIVQHQRHVINKIANHNTPESFQHSVAGILDDRSDSPEKCKGLTLDGVTAKEDEKKYGGMFLDGIADGITFYFAYPNLYIITDDESVLVTHGHYFHPYWSFMGELVQRIAYYPYRYYDDDNDWKLKKMLRGIDIEKTVQLNFPLNQFACTGIGQAGILTDKIVRRIELDVKNRELKKVEKYLNRLEKVTENRFLQLLLIPIKGLVKLMFSIFRDWLIKKIDDMDPRYNKPFFQNNSDRIKKFYEAVLEECDSINENNELPFKAANRPLPVPKKIIFGHTHNPTSWKKPVKPFSRGPCFCNTGGWLKEKNKFEAEIFFYETGKGFSSVRV